MPSNENEPKWDVALASFANDEYRKKSAPLTLDDFRVLARENAMRLDDIMETIFLLTIHKQWKYLDRTGKEQHIDQETLDNLYVKRRLSDQDLSVFDGGWQPV